jgi:hypothetical protein
MRRPRRALRSTLAVLLPLLAPGALAQEPEPTLVPFVVDACRVPTTVEASALFYHPGRADGGPAPVRLEALRVDSGGIRLVERALDEELVGDPAYGRLTARIERLPAGVSHSHRPHRSFAGEHDHAVPHADLGHEFERITEELDALRARWAASDERPLSELRFPLHLDQLFAPEDAPGTARAVVIEVDWRGADGALRTARTSRTVRKLAPRPALPPTVSASWSTASGGGGGTSLVAFAGDLHVHSCHGEAVGACSPSGNCAAESLQTSGSFSYAQLRTQYQALGMDWFSASDHSYCIDAVGEYAAVQSECAAITDSSFVAFPDIELSSDEEGPQQGSDLDGLICLFGGGSSQNHMGAHGISSGLPGGSQGLFGFCGGSLSPFTSNIAAVRAQGGFPIANHPAAGEFAWNSFANTAGIEGDGLQGVEIWNGASQSGQGGHVAQWVDWLLTGRLLYAYSGSDTHDEAFDFGANNVIVEGGTLSAAGLIAGLKAGRLWLSRDHALVTEVVLGGLRLPMGALQTLPPGQGASPLTIETHYDFGADSGTITVFRGRVGDASEAVLCQSGTLTGQGVHQCADTLTVGARSWYRSYSEAGGKASYGNPIFFLPGGCGPVAYGVGLGGANTGTLASDTSPAIGARQELAISGFTASPWALLSLNAAKLDPGVAWGGGWILVLPPSLAALPVFLTGGTGALVFDMPWSPDLIGGTLYWQAVAPDGAQPQGWAFSNGLEQTLCGLGM